MTSTQVTFGKAWGDQAQALAQSRLAASALSFIEQGVRDPYASRNGSSVATVGLMVQTRLLEQAAGGGIVPDAQRMAHAWRAGAWEAALKTAYQAFLAGYVDTASLYFGRIPPPWVGILDHKLEAKLAVEFCGMAPLDEPTETDPVKYAYEMARFNTLRCEQRIALLYLLGNMVRPPHGGDIPNAAAQTEFDLTSRQLWVNRSLHLSRQLAFGTLLGGEYLERNKTLVKKMYGDGMSVIELLQVDGEVPGRWQTSTEDKLRKAIAKA